MRVGDAVIGGDQPIVVQSMTTTPTQDTKSTVEQIQRLVDVGCQIVRVTTPTTADVDNLPSIKAEMKKRGLKVPLVADVHFLPKIALKACDWVEKVRINPGNFADRKKFEVKEYTDAQYNAELERIHSVFSPIVLRAKKNGISLRIGTNHGSLSDRIMNRFGDTPLGMVESALEFIRISQDHGFHDLVISMKASNPKVMIQAYRLLVAKMDELEMDYPLHLGVTEAGDGEDGRVKSAVGIGSLLADGLGDTVRVSLTEEPEEEIPVARCLVEQCRLHAKPYSARSIVPSWNLYEYERRSCKKLSHTKFAVGERETVRVRATVAPDLLESFVQTIRILDPKPDAVAMDLDSTPLKTEDLNKLPKELSLVLRFQEKSPFIDFQLDEVLFDELSLKSSPIWREEPYISKLETLMKNRILWLRVSQVKEVENAVYLLRALHSRVQTGVEVEGRDLIALSRLLAARLHQEGLHIPLHLHYQEKGESQRLDTMMKASLELGSLLCDGIGDSIEVSSPSEITFNSRLAFNILQASRLRIFKTEYIACPSCGRTLFDLQETTARIREKTAHLKGVKIAIMGCIVNGPGEMADADFGYVGSGPGFINLYVGKECVERHIPQKEADQRLIGLIKRHGRWIEPSHESRNHP